MGQRGALPLRVVATNGAQPASVRLGAVPLHFIKKPGEVGPEEAHGHRDHDEKGDPARRVQILIEVHWEARGDGRTDLGEA